MQVIVCKVPRAVVLGNYDQPLVLHQQFETLFERLRDDVRQVAEELRPDPMPDQFLIEVQIVDEDVPPFHAEVFER